MKHINVKEHEMGGYWRLIWEECMPPLVNYPLTYEVGMVI